MDRSIKRKYKNLMKMSINKNCKEWIDSLPTPNDILKETQKSGRKVLESISMPNNKEERWRLSKLNSVNKMLQLPTKISGQKINQTAKKSYPREEDNVLRLILDQYDNPLNNISLPNGIRKLDNSEIKKVLENSISRNIQNKDFLTSINHASNKQVIALSIETEGIANLEIIIPSEENKFSATRIILIVKKNTHLNLLEVILGAKNSAQSHIMEIEIGSQAKVNHGIIALGLEKDSSLLANLNINQNLDSEYSLTSCQEGWDFSRLEPDITQTDGEAKTIIKGLQVSSSTEQIATHSNIIFNGPNGHLDQLQKSIAKDRSHCIFNGMIKVPQIAQKTQAAQLSKNLLLSKGARIDTKPELEIIADDVRCTHGATISQLQEEELFYLRSRGIDNKKASLLLLRGYYQEIINELPLNPIKWGYLSTLLNEVK